MSAFEQYISIMQDSSVDADVIITTEKGDFSASEIMSMSKYLWLKDGKRGGIWGKETIGFFNRVIRKLAIRKEIVAENSKAIAEIAAARLPEKEVIYVSNFQEAGVGPSVSSTNWDGTHSISLGYDNHAAVRYSDYEKIGDYYFFNEQQFSRVFAFDEKGFNYLMFGKLNHEQKVAASFIEFIGETFESMHIKTRYDLSKLTEDLVNGKYGSASFNTHEINHDSAEAIVQTKNGEFVFNAAFSGYERQHVMRDILNAR